MSANPLRDRRAKIFYGTSAVVLISLFFFLAWSLRMLFLPAIIGALSAYICAPLLNRMHRFGVSREISVLLLFGVFTLLLALAAMQIQSVLPDEKGKLELKVHIKYRLNEKYRHYMGLDSTGTSGNMAYDVLGREFNPMVNRLNNFLLFSHYERSLFEKYKTGYKGEPPISQKIIQYDEANLQEDIKSNRKIDGEDPVAHNTIVEKEESGHSMAHWIILPFVFLFLLMDNGAIKRYFVGLVPNRYFEVALTVLDNVDEAIGNYLRGTFLECSLVGLTFIVLLALFGFQFKWAVIIGVISGMTTAIPFLGTAIGLLTGAAYALL